MLRRTDVANLGTGKVLYLRGTPYEQGKQLGQGAAELIHENVRRAARLRHRIAPDLDLRKYRAMTRRNEAWVARELPELLDEISGVAEGANVDYEELLSMNVNTDGAYARAYAVAMGCTQVIATGTATVDGKTYVAKTRDLTRGPLGQVLLHREYDDGSWHNEFQVAGQFTLPVGMNQHGVTFTTSGVWSRQVVVDLGRGDRAWHILNLMPALRRARSTDEAIGMLRDQPRLWGMQALVTDGRRSVALEVTDRDMVVCEPEADLVVRTNHFLSPQLRHFAPTVEENPGTYQRHARARELLAGRHGRIQMRDLFRVMTDHSPEGESICRHGDGDGTARTVAVAFFCPEDREMWTIIGNPCEGVQMVGRPGD